MAITENNYTGNGSKVTYDITFEYLKESDIKVSIDGIDQATTAYSFTSITTITFGTAPANGAAVRIYRDTNIDSLRNEFFAGSAIRAQDLNEDFKQTLFVVQELDNNTWDNETNTIHSDETWVSSDDQIATTAALDARFQDEANETITSAETWVADDNHIATTQAIEDRIDEVITNDIAGSDGISITDDGDGTITVGINANSVDFDRIKDDDIITYAEQNAGSPGIADTNIFTASAAARRFDTLVQTSTPSGSNWEVGKTWFQNDADKTVSIWNGSSWEGVVSGGTFTKLDKVIYVDSVNGLDTNDGHRISTPKKTIGAALDDINSDSTYGDGSTILVSPGVYQETAPLDIQKKDVSIIGASIRNVIVHPTPATETNSLFRVNSGTYLQNMTFTGVKASGTRGDTGSLWEDSTYGLPPTQGWNVSFYPDAMIYKSPYIQNCTNFSDSEIDNSDLSFFAGTEDKGRAGDLDSAPTGGGLLVDGSTVNIDSPLRSMVADSYTHVGLDGPGIFVTNNGYTQITSSYAFFNHFHIACINGGQANLAASTTDFGRYSLIADGKSTDAVITASTNGTSAQNDTTFDIDNVASGTNWHGSATRPQDNMLVVVDGVTYPVLSATAITGGWRVTISRPDTNDRTVNLGLSAAIADNTDVFFYLRSMIASSGHTMEYVGSGTDYTALPENGGVPNDSNQKVELNNGKIWTAITDHRGTFRVGDTFEVNQQTGFVNIPAGALSVSKLLEDLDVNGNSIVSSSNGNIVVNPDGTGNIQLDANVGIGTASPTSGSKLHVQTASSGATANSQYADLTVEDSAAAGVTVLSGASSFGGFVFGDSGSGDVGGFFYDHSNDAMIHKVNGAERLRIDSSGNVGVGTSSIASNGSGTTNFNIHTPAAYPAYLKLSNSLTGNTTADGFDLISAQDGIAYVWNRENAAMRFATNNAEAMRIDSSGNVGIGTSSPGSYSSVANNLVVQDTAGEGGITIVSTTTGGSNIFFADTDSASQGQIKYQHSGDYMRFYTANAERLRIDSSGNVGIGVTPTAGRRLHVSGTGTFVQLDSSNISNLIKFTNSAASGGFLGYESDNLVFYTNNTVRLKIDSSGNVGINNTSPLYPLDVKSTSGDAWMRVDSAGSTSNSGYRFAHDGTNHFVIYHNGSNDSLAFYNNVTATQPLTLTNAGRLGIGSTAPGQNLEVGDASTPKIRFQRTGSFYWDIGHTSSDFQFESQDNGVILHMNYDGNVGVGTTNPSQKLDVAGSINLTGNQVFSTTTTPFIVANASGSVLRFGTAGSERARIDSSGNVGIKTTAPSYTLDINSTDNNAIRIRGTNDNPLVMDATDSGPSYVSVQRAGTRVAYYGFGGSGDTFNIINETSTGSITLGTNSTTRLQILSSGNVGIGLSPTAKLHVAGTIQSSVGSHTAQMYSDGGAAFFTSVGAYPSIFYTNSSERMRITSSGYVGIGKSTPTEKLHVRDANDVLIKLESDSPSGYVGIDYQNDSRLWYAGIRADASNAWGIRDESANATRLVVDTSGNVGIGVTSPSAPLAFGKSIYGDPSSENFYRIKFTDFGGITNDVGIGQPDEYSLGLNVQGGSTSSIRFSAGTAGERMRIDGSGRLLVGTSASLGNGATLQTSGQQVNYQAFHHQTAQAGPFVILSKSNGTQASPTVVTHNDYLGIIGFSGYDGTDYLTRGAEIACQVDGTPGSNDMPGRLVFSTTADGASSPTERMRITSNSQVWINTTTGTINTTNFGTNIGLILNHARNTDGGNAVAQFYGTAGTARIMGDGDLQNTNNSYGAISDIKLKENIVNANSQWNDLKTLQIRSYNFKPETGYSTHTQIGVVAQEVETVSPGLVTESPDLDAEGNDLGTTTKSVNYSVLYMKAVKALQEAMERIETLESKVAALEAAN